MRSIVKWIIYVPVCLLSLLLMFFSCLSPESIRNMFGADMNGVARIVSFSVVGIFVLFILFALFDRTTSPIHLLKKNYFCGVTGVLAAFSMAAIVALDASSLFRTGDFDVMSVLTLIFTVLAAVAMLFMGLNHFTGVNSPGAVSILYLSVPLWSGVHLVSRFMDHTASPVAAADTLDLVMFVSLALATLYFVMVHSQITGKNAVKSAVVFGAPAVVATLAFAVTQYFTAAAQSGSDVFSYIPAVCYTFIGLYVFGFVAELSFTSKTKDEQRIVEAACVADAYPEDISDDEKSHEMLHESYRSAGGSTEAEESVDVSADDEAYEESDNDSYDEICDEPSDEPDDETDEEFDDEPADDERDSLEVLYSRAKDQDRTDSGAVTDTSTGTPEISIGSEDEMIIKDEKEPVAAQKNAPAGAPKGRTLREPILIEDDFILSINSKDSYEKEEEKKDDDVSFYIMDSSVRPEDEDTARSEKDYESRLDEIDQLILSIEGGKSAADGVKSE